jgi:SAM-dependent methyltransferase
MRCSIAWFNPLPHDRRLPLLRRCVRTCDIRPSERELDRITFLGRDPAGHEMESTIAVRKSEALSPKEHLYWLHYRTLEPFIIESLGRSSAPFLDLGCGGRPYRPFCPAGTVGADVSQNATGSVDVIITPAQRLPFDSSSFAGVLCAQVLEHVPDPVMLLDEICRILRHGGQLILTCPFVWELHEEPHDYLRFTKYWLAQNLENAGFSRTKIIPQGGDIAMIGQCILLFTGKKAATPAEPAAKMV